jgi:drug/metabolite transporter (DMT)-like permease
MDARARGSLQVAAAACVWGLWSLFVRPSGLPGLESAAIMMTALALAGIPSQWRGRRRARPASAWMWMAVFGVLDAGNSGFFFLAVTRGPVAVATLSHYLAPVLTPLMALVLLRERPSRRTYPAALIGLLGLVLLLLPSSGVGAVAGREALWTAIFGACSAVFYATMVPLGKKLAPHFSPLEVQGYHSYVSAALLWLVAPHIVVAWLGLGKLLAGCALCGIAAGGLFYSGIRLIPSGLASVLTYGEPLVATVVGAVAFHEVVQPIGFLGVAMVVGGGVWLAMESRGLAAPVPPPRLRDGR